MPRRPDPRRRASARRGTITTILLIMIVVMIVRDIFVRRRARRAAAPDVTHRPVDSEAVRRKARKPRESLSRGPDATPSHFHRLAL